MSIYESSYLGTTTNRVQFNDYATFPIFRVQSRRPQQRNIRELDIAIPFENGISDFETLVGKTAYIVEGTMYPGSEDQYDTGLAALRKVASLEISQDDNEADDGYVPYVFTEFALQKQIFMKVLYVDIPETTRKGLVQPFRLVCKVKDPTIYEVDARIADTAPSSFTTSSGSAIYPFEYPIIYGSSTSSVSATARNIGDISVYPSSIVINGPVNIPKITNTTTGEFIQISTNLPTVANVLTITYDKDTLRAESNGDTVLNNVTTDSTWFRVVPGDNTFTLTGTSISDDASAQVNFRSGWPLS